MITTNPIYRGKRRWSTKICSKLLKRLEGERYGRKKRCEMESWRSNSSGNRRLQRNWVICSVSPSLNLLFSYYFFFLLKAKSNFSFFPQLYEGYSSCSYTREHLITKWIIQLNLLLRCFQKITFPYQTSKFTALPNVEIRDLHGFWSRKSRFKSTESVDFLLQICGKHGFRYLIVQWIS